MQNEHQPATVKSLKLASKIVASLLCLAGSAWIASADKINLSSDAMRKISTDVIVGQVQSINQTVEDTSTSVYTHYTAHVKISRVEKGDSLHPGTTCDVRYWRRASKPTPASSTVSGHTPPPLGSFSATGHRGMPKVGDTTRIYLARNAYDGFTYSNKDGGYNVIGPNGFEGVSAPFRHQTPRAK